MNKKVENFLKNYEHKDTIYVMLDLCEEKDIPEDFEFLEKFCKSFVYKQRMEYNQKTDVIEKKYKEQLNELKLRFKFFRLGKKLYYGKYFYFWTNRYKGYFRQRIASKFYVCTIENDKIKVLNKSPFMYQAQAVKFIDERIGVKNKKRNSLNIKF